jgi:hypothetical protein
VVALDSRGPRSVVSFHLVRSWRSRSPSPSKRSQALGGAHLSSLSEHESRAHQFVRRRITRLERSRSSGSTSGSSDQRDGARESAHQTRARPQGSRDGLATTDKTGTPNDRGTTRGFLLRRARPTVPRALGASWSPPRATSRTRLRHRRGDQPCGRSLIARPHGVRLGVTMRVHRVRIVRAYRPLRSQDGAASLELIQQHSHRCWSTRGYHAWTKRITVRAAGSKANAKEQCRPSRASSAACRWTRRGDACARPTAGTPGRS